jgi:hypothetical protein
MKRASKISLGNYGKRDVSVFSFHLWLIFLTVLLLLPAQLFAAQATFTPRASVSGQYTDNLFLEPEQEESDFITTASVGFTASLIGKRGDINLSYDPAYAFYNDFDENDTWRHAANLNGEWNFTQYTRLDFSNDFLRTEDPLSKENIDILRGDVPPPQGDTTRRIGRDPYYSNRANVRLTNQFGREDQVYIGYTNNLLINDNDLTEEDSQTNSGSGGLTYWFTNQWGSEVGGAYSNVSFDQDDNFIGDPSSDYDQWSGFVQLNRRFSRSLNGFIRYDHTYLDYDEEDEFDYNTFNPSIGIDYFIEEDIQFLASVGYLRREFQDAVIQDIQEELDRGEGLTFTADLLKTLQRGNYRLYAAGGYEQTVNASQNLGFTRYYIVGYSGNYQLYRRVGVDSFGLYRRNEYEDEIPQRDDDVYRFGIGMSYGPTQWMEIRLGYGFNKIDSNVNTNDYTENRGTLTITVFPEQPYRTTF